MVSKKLISIVIPCYNEEENIARTLAEITRVISGISNYRFEVILVDNGSSDNSVAEMRQAVSRDPVVSAVLLERNFGPEASGLAGFTHAQGDAVILIMADLQDPPDLIPEFLKRWEEGYQLVLGQVTTNEEGRVMRTVRRWFYAILQRISYIDISSGVTGYGLFDKRVNDRIVAMPERNRFFRGLLAWTGARRCLIPYQRRRRQFGRSYYGFLSYLQHAERGFFSFTTLPLDIITYLGIFLVGLSVMGSLAYIVWVFAFGNPIKGSATLFLAIMFFGGAQIFAVSIVGKYIGIIFEEIKQRPHYLVREIVRQSGVGDDRP